MTIELVKKENNSDHSGPVLDIYYTKEEAFDMGRLFEKLKNINAAVWMGKNHIRIPLVLMDEIGLAITYKRKGINHE